MEIEPPSLNAPLQRKEHWALWLAAACISVTAVAAFFSPSFAIVFGASTIAGLPILLLLMFPSKASATFSVWGDIGRIASAAAFFGYIAIAKLVLIPVIIGIIERALS